MIRFFFIVLLLSGMSAKSFACIPTPRSEPLQTHDELIEQTASILLVKVKFAELTEIPKQPEYEVINHDLPPYGAIIEEIRYKNEKAGEQYERKKWSYKPVTYGFEVIEVIKGLKPEKDVAILGYAPRQAMQLNDFNFHQEEKFWTEDEGRTFWEQSCANDPSFSVGEMFLLFMHITSNKKRYELIRSVKKDKWLAYVKEKVNGSD